MKKIMTLLMIAVVAVGINMPAVGAVDVNTTQENYAEAGTYPISVSAVDENGVEVTKTILVTVLFEKSVVFSEIGEAIDAHDIMLESGTFQQLSDVQLIQIAGAHAWLLSDGSPVAITSVIRQTIQSEQSYQVLFGTERGSSITINVLESKEKIIPINNIYINPIDYGVGGSANFIILGLFLFILIIIPIIIFTIQYLIVRKERRIVEELLYREE